MSHSNFRTEREFWLRNKLQIRLLVVFIILVDFLMISIESMPHVTSLRLIVGIAGQLDAVNHFSYTGTAESVTVPLEVNSINVYMW